MTAAITSPVFGCSSEEIPSVTRIAIFAATWWELQAILTACTGMPERMIHGAHVFTSRDGGRELWIARTGVGLAKARTLASGLLRQQTFHLVVSTGFACALVQSRIGELLVGREVILAQSNGTELSRVISASGAEQDVVMTLVKDLVPMEHIGTFVSVDRIIVRASEKRHCAHATNAIALDMESAALAVEADKARVPFVIVRTASDLLEEDLPLDFNLFLRPTTWAKGLVSVIRAPSSLLGLTRLRRQSVIAAKTLTTFFQHYLNATTMLLPNMTRHTT